MTSRPDSRNNTILIPSMHNNNTHKYYYHLFIQELKAQCHIAIPTILGLIFYKIPWMISLHFVGELGSEALAAAALATTLCNVTGMSFSVGLSSAITTLTGQARGHLLRNEQHHDNHTSTYRNNHNHHLLEHGDDDDDDDDDENGVHIVGDTMSLLQLPMYLNETNTEKIMTVTSSSAIVEEKKTEFTPLLSHIDIKRTNHDHYNDNHSTTNLNSNHKNNSPLLPLVFLYRGIIIQLAIVIPIGLWWLHGIEPMLLFLGQAEELSKMTATYLKILTPGLWSYSINWTVTAWLQTIEMADIPAYTAFIGFILHIPFNILFVRVLGFGYEGVAMATVSFQLLQPVIILFYIFGTKRGRDRILTNSGAKAIGKYTLSFWPELYAATSSFAGMRQYLELGFPGMIAISEWWASECCIFLAGTLHPYPDFGLGAMSIYQSINTFCFMFPMGFSTAGCSRVGLFLGRNLPNNASAASKFSLLFTGSLSLTCGLILYFTPHTTFPSLFTSDQNVIMQASYTIPFLAYYVIADGIQIGLQGTIKGCGRQFVMAPIVLFSYWVVGVPLSYYNVFVRNNGIMECSALSLCGVRGLIFGLLIGTWIHMLLLLIVVSFTINWRVEASLAEARMTLKQNDGNLA